MVDVNVTGLSDTGTELGGFMLNIGPGLFAFILGFAVVGGVAGLIGAVIYMMKKKVK